MSMRDKKLDMPYSQIDDVQEYVEAFDLETSDIDFNVIDEYKESPYALDASTLNSINDDVNIMQNNWSEDIDETLDDKAELFQSWIDNLGKEVRPWSGDVTVSGDVVTFEADEDTIIFDLKADINPVQDGTPWWSDKNTLPYLMKKSPQLDHVYSKETNTLIGGTVAWNQLVQNGNFADTSGWYSANSTFSVSNNKCTVTATAQNGNIYQSNYLMQNGHKYLMTADITANNTTAIRIDISGAFPKYTKAVSERQNVYSLFNWSYATNNIYIPHVLDTRASGWDSFVVENFMLIDLTALFGSAEIADYVYSLEQTTAGSGIAWLKSHGFIDGSYRAFDSGSLQSVKTSEHRTVGFNQWDEEWESGDLDVNGEPTADATKIRAKNYIPIFGSTNYCFTALDYTGDYLLCYYDADKNFISRESKPNPSSGAIFTTPSDAYYMKFRMATAYGTTYNHDICINISDPSKNGQYEPYEVHSYPLDPNLELRGLFKLDANNNLYADGDVYESSGAVTRKYGIVDLGTLDWLYNSTNLVFSASLTTRAIGADNFICGRYSIVIGTTTANLPDKSMRGGLNDKAFYLKDSAYTSASDFKTAMSGVYLVYELATPTTEQADPYASPQVVNPLGTEEYVDTRDVPVPVGHETYYAEFYPISGWDEVNVTRSGKNLIDVSNSIYGLCGYKQGDNIDTVYSSYRYRHSLPVRADNGLVCSYRSDDVLTFSDVLIECFDESGNWVYQIPGGSRTTDEWQTKIVPPNAYKWVRVVYGAPSGVTLPSDISGQVQLEFGSTATEYELYQGNTYTIDLDGTRYSGTLDVTRGELIVDMASITFDGSNDENWQWESNVNRGFIQLQNANTGESARMPYLCNIGEYSQYGATPGVTFIYGATGVLFYYTPVTSLADFKTWLSNNPLQAVFKLATPITVQLTPTAVSTLLGTNNVWADSGDVSVTYGANVLYYKNDIMTYSEDVGAMFLCLQDCDGSQPLPTALTVANDYWLRVYDKGKTGLNVYNLTDKGKFNWQNNYVVNDVVWIDERHINFYVCINNVSYTINNTPNYDSVHWVKLFSVYRDGMPVYWEIPNQNFFNDIHSPSVFGVAQGTLLNFDSIDVLNNITNITEEDSSLRLLENETILLTIYKQDGNAYNSTPILHCGTLINVPLIESGVIYKIPLNFLFYNMHMGLLCIYEEGMGVSFILAKLDNNDNVYYDIDGYIDENYFVYNKAQYESLFPNVPYIKIEFSKHTSEAPILIRLINRIQTQDINNPQYIKLKTSSDAIVKEDNIVLITLNDLINDLIEENNI